MRHMGESNDIEEIHSIPTTVSGESIFKLQCFPMGLDVDGLRHLHPKRS